MAAPGTPLQVLIAVLIMLSHLLVVLKLAPYESDGEDVSSFLSSLTLTLTTIGGIVLMTDGNDDGSNKTFNSNGLAYILIAISVLCIASQIGITIFIDCGVWELIREFRNKSDTDVETLNTDVALNQILPTNEHLNETEGNNETGNENEVRVDVSAGVSANEQRLKELKLQKEIKKQERLNATKWKIRKKREHTRSTNKIINDHAMHEKGFQEKTDKRQERAKRKTALRLQARIKLKDSKVLQVIPAFKMLKKEEVNVIIETMDHIVR